MKRHSVTLLILLLSVFSANAYEAGIGTRATGLSNNHTALTSGIPDLYWNPGALAFSVSREYQISLQGIRLASSSEFFDDTEDDDMQRITINNAGFSYALPATRGGMSIAASYSRPILFDDAYSFTGRYSLDDTLVRVRDRTFHVSGNLSYWTIGTGMQVAENLGVGIAAALIHGADNTQDYLSEIQSFDDNTSYYSYDMDYKGEYLGYDVRAGMLYRLGNLSTGIRIVFPSQIHLNESAKGYDGDYYYNTTDKYKMYSSFSGAWGISALFPHFTVSTEVRSIFPFDFIFPVEDIPSGCQAGHFKTGGGIGIEVPLIIAPAVFRLGYSLDEYDLHPWVYDFIEGHNNTTSINWSDGGMEVNRNLHRISTGLSFTTASTSFDISYQLSTWGITTDKNLKQTYYLNRLLTSFTVRF